MNQNPLVSIVIPAWNGIEYIEDCLNSLLSQDYPDFEIIVVDNASSDGTPEWVAERFPTVTLICNERNLGFAGAVNVGLRAARGDVLMLFNQDAAARPGWMRAMVLGLTASPDVGIAGCKIYYWDRKTIWHAGVIFPDPRMQMVHRGDGETDHGQYEQPVDVDAVTGAAMAIRRGVLNAIGLLDEDYFVYFEDIDFCLRAKEAGYRVAYLPQAVAQHHVATSLGFGSLRIFERYHRSRILFLLKHFEADWLRDRFFSAEVDWLKKGLNFHEYRLLRTAYLHAMLGLIQGGELYQFVRRRFDREQREVIAKVFSRLTEAIFEAMQIEPGVRLGILGEETGNWWQVTERPFTSSVPLLGRYIARFREIWNNVAARWYVRGLLVQQLEINRRLVLTVEMNNRLIQDLNRDVVLLSQHMARLPSERDIQNREAP
jgi:GT2 family glycosyltransferase